MQNNKKRLNYYAKILIFFSFGLMFYGFVLDFYNDKKLINPIEDVVSLKEEKNTVSITTIDGNEVVPGNKIVNSDDGNNSDNFSLENNNSSSNSSIDEVNDKLRESIQDTYGITIKFGRETIGYKRKTLFNLFKAELTTKELLTGVVEKPPTSYPIVSLPKLIVIP